MLLFFGWLTGAQLIFATHKMQAANPWRLVFMMAASFTIVVVGYTLISHAFDVFLYPDPAMRSQIYAAANVDLVLFDVLVAFIVLVVVLGWLRVYYAERKGVVSSINNALWLNFYALISREFYLIDIYGWVSRRLLSLASRLNVWLRWA